MRFFTLVATSCVMGISYSLVTRSAMHDHTALVWAGGMFCAVVWAFAFNWLYPRDYPNGS